jgi:hypothetical protein
MHRPLSALPLDCDYSYTDYLDYVLSFDYVQLYFHYITPSLSPKISVMSSLFPSYSEIDRSKGCMLFCHACFDISVIYKYLVSIWIWLYASISFIPLVGSPKLILYHVNFIIHVIVVVNLNAVAPSYLIGVVHSSSWWWQQRPVLHRDSC